MSYIIYSSHPEIQQIKVWQLNTKNNTQIKLLQIIDVEGSPQPIVINVVKRIFYVGIRPNFSILTFKINLDGTLFNIGNTRFPGSISYISIDSNFSYIFSASYNNALFTISKLQKDSVPHPPHQIINNIQGCHSVNIEPSNNFLFVPALLEDCIYLYKLNKNGSISSNYKDKINVEKNSGPRHMSFHPKKKYFYSLNELSSTIDIWNMQSIIKKIQTISIFPKNYNKFKWAADIHITPNGKYLYACDRTANIISIFTTDKHNGFIKKIGQIITEQQPRSFSIDNTGSYLAVAGQKSHAISVYKINKDSGNLEFVTRQIIGINPIWITINKFI